MKPAPILLLSILLLSACGEAPQDNLGKHPRQYDEKALAMGERVFHTHCSSCHGYNGEGNPGWQKPGPDGKLLPPPLDDKGRTSRLSRAEIKQFIAQGSPDGRGNMPAWQGKLSEQEMGAVVTWITSLWSDQSFLDWRTKTEHVRQ